MRRPTLGLLLLLLLVVPAAPAAESERVVAISAGRVLLGDGEEIGPATVLVRGDFIEDVGPDVAVPDGAVRIDARKDVVMPGLISAHAWLDRENQLAEPARAATPHLRASAVLDPESEALGKERESGVTALFLAPSDASVVGGRPALVLTDDSGTVLSETVGTKLALGVPALGNARYPATHWGALELIREQRDLPGPWFIHARSTGDVRAALHLMRGYPAFDYRLVHGDHAWRYATELAQAHATVVWGPAGTDSETLVLSGPRILAEAGVGLAFATDGSPGSLRRTAVLAHRGGLPRRETIVALFSGAAEIVGAGDRIGRIAPGFRADVTIMTGDPLDLSAGVRRVIVGGRTVFLSQKEDER